MRKMLVPSPCQGIQKNIPVHPGYEWIKQLPDKNIYFALFQGWPTQKLPSGYDYYIVSFHLEAVDIAWLKQQQVTGPIIVLFDGNHYDVDITGVYFMPFFYWHYQLQQMQNWFGIQEKKQPKYKFSAVCNRITQSKIWVTTKLLDSARESSLIVLHNWLDEKNVHGWQLTGNTVLDQLTQLFQTKYLEQEITIDTFENLRDNNQRTTGNPWQPLYQDCAIHFTNESFHYSYMSDAISSYIYPGPFITEKTLKCLLGSTAFISVGQFETYKTLTNLGFEFDYGFDISWDLDPGNISRATSIINLIDYLNQIDIDQLVITTRDSCQHNQNHVLTAKFFNQCQQQNIKSIGQIVDLVR